MVHYTKVASLVKNMAIERWGEVEGVYTHFKGTKMSASVDEIKVTLHGIDDDTHRGDRRKKIGVRDRTVLGLPKKPDNEIPVWQWRAVSLVSRKELAQIAANLGIPHVDANEMAKFLSANVLVDGMARFSQIRPGSALHFYGDDSEQLPSGLIMPTASMFVTAENLPCEAPGQLIHREHPSVNPKEVEAEAANLRGVMAVVLCAGEAAAATIRSGMTVRLWQKGRLENEKKAAKDDALRQVAAIFVQSGTLVNRLHTWMNGEKMAEVAIVLLDHYEPERIANLIESLNQMSNALRRDRDIMTRVQVSALKAALPIHLDELPPDMIAKFREAALRRHQRFSADDAGSQELWDSVVLEVLQALMRGGNDVLKIVHAIALTYNRSMKAA